MLVVEALLDDSALERLLANLHFHLSAELAVGGIDQRHADALARRDRVVACGHLANLLTLEEHLVAVTGDSLVGQLDAHDATLRAFGLLLLQGFLTEELFLVELAEHRQTGHHGRDVVAQLVAVEGQTHLEAQGVATAQSAGQTALALHELVPRAADIVGRAIDLEAVLTGIARAAQDDGLAVDVNGLAV